MIIFGYTTKGKVIETNSFKCPACHGSRYELTEYSRYFTLFFIPLFPYYTVGRQIVCSTCKRAYVAEGTSMTGQPISASDSSDSVVAPPLKRAGSFIIDFVMVAVVASLAGVLLPASALASTLSMYSFYSLMWLFYGIACEALFSGRTIGKLAVNIKTKQSDGSAIAMNTILIRNLVKAPLMFFTSPLVALFVLVRSDRKAPHDLAAGTGVFDRQ